MPKSRLEHFCRGLRVLVYAVCWVCLISFAWFYLGHLYRTGGTSEYTYQTGPQEPKAAAYAAVVADSAGRSSEIFSDHWFNHWPLEFLAHRDAHIDVSFYHRDPAAPFRIPRPKGKARIYVVVEAGGALEQKMIAATHGRWQPWQAIQGYGGRDLIHIYRILRPSDDE